MNNQMFEINHNKSDMYTECRNFFDDKWHLYQKVLINNYMNHQESYQVIKSLFENSKVSNFKLLDLGCGDSSYISKTLQNIEVSSYIGLDISKTAIQIARQNTSLLSCERSFIEGDLLSTLPLLNSSSHNVQQYDFILSSFAFHHFNSDLKDKLFSQIVNLLAPSGKFILVDFLRDEEETRESYISRYLRLVKQDWKELSNSEVDLLTEHMMSSDYPETKTTLTSLALKNRFKKVEFLCNKQDMTQICCFSV